MTPLLNLIPLYNKQELQINCSTARCSLCYYSPLWQRGIRGDFSIFRLVSPMRIAQYLSGFKTLKHSLAISSILIFISKFSLFRYYPFLSAHQSPAFSILKASRQACFLFRLRLLSSRVLLKPLMLPFCL